jgi:anthranilate phosphoribosyltransferase
MMMKDILNIIRTQALTKKQAYDLQKSILNQELSQEDIIKLFAELEHRDISNNELIGFVEASLQNMNYFDNDLNLLDIVGTGGDNLNTINVSTISSVVCASMGCKIAKHGNRSVSSKCGSADLLESLGIKIDLDIKSAQKLLAITNFVFLFAPLYHQAFAYVKEPRKAFGKRTYFNLLGPLLNPAKAKNIVLGVYDKKYISLFVDTLLACGTINAYVVCGKNPAIDEISISGNTYYQQIINGQSDGILYEFDPKEYGFDLHDIKDIVGGDVDTNTIIAKKILSGNGNDAQNQAIILNAGFALSTYEQISLKLAFDKVSKKLLSGQCLDTLKEIINVSQNV